VEPAQSQEQGAPAARTGALGRRRADREGSADDTGPACLTESEAVIDLIVSETIPLRLIDL
jgi:hypothetical protein